VLTGARNRRLLLSWWARCLVTPRSCAIQRASGGSRSRQLAAEALVVRRGPHSPSLRASEEAADDPADGRPGRGEGALPAVDASRRSSRYREMALWQAASFVSATLNFPLVWVSSALAASTRFGTAAVADQPLLSRQVATCSMIRLACLDEASERASQGARLRV
jgi:hypothetical protein